MTPFWTCGFSFRQHHWRRVPPEHSEHLLPQLLLLKLISCLQPFSLSRHLNAQLTLDTVSSFPSRAQQELLKLFSSLLLGWPGMETPAPSSIVYTSFPRAAPLTVTPSPKTSFHTHSPLLPPSSSTGSSTDVYVCI